MATALVIVLILLLILLSTFLSPKRGPAEFPKTPKDEFVLKWIAAGLRYSGKTATFADSETACRLAIKCVSSLIFFFYTHGLTHTKGVEVEGR